MSNFKCLTMAAVCGLAVLVSTTHADQRLKPNESRPIRVALVTATNASPETKSLLDLATVEVSRLENVELLDRADVLRVLNEQKLALSGLASDQHALIVGKLLKADVFVCLETDALNLHAFAATAFDAATGVRLLDAPLASQVDKSARHLTDFVQRAMRKRRLGQALKTVGFVSVRNADLPRDWDSRGQAISRLLERRVLEAKSITVLERRRLEHITRERALPTEDSDRALLASIILVDLQVSRGTAANGLKLSAELKSRDGKVLKTVSVECETRTALLAAEKMLPKLVAALDQPVNPSAYLAPEVEAEYFAQEAHVLIGQQLEISAIAALETAIALAPNRMEYHLMLQKVLLVHTEKMLKALLQKQRETMKRVSASSLADVLGLVRRTLEARRVLVEIQRQPDVNPAEVFGRQNIRFHVYNQAYESIWWNLDFFSSDDREVHTELRELRMLFRELVLLSLQTHQTYASQHPEALANYTAELESALMLSNRWCGTAIEIARDLRRMVQPWLKAVAENKTRPNVLNRAGHPRHVLRHIPKPEHLNQRIDWDGAEMSAEILELAKEMSNHPDSLVRLWAGFLNDFIRRETKAVDETTDQAAWTRWKADVRELLSSPDAVADRVARGSLYELWSIAIDLRQRRPKGSVDPTADAARQSRIAAEHLELFADMAGRQDVFLQGKLEGILGLYQFDAAQLEAAISTQDQLMAALLRIPPEQREGSIDDMRATLNFRMRQLVEQRPTKSPPKPAEPNGITFKVLYSASGLAAGKMRAGPLTHPIVRDGIAYCTSWGMPMNANSETNVSTVKLIAQPLNGDPPRLISECVVPRPPQFDAGKPWSVVKTTCLSERDYIVVIDGVGVVLLPLKEGAARVVGIQAGLPTNEMQTADVLDDKLFLGTKGGYLIEYDLKSRSMVTVVSAQRKLAESPLDNSSDLQVMQVIADPPRSRVVLSVCLNAKDERDQVRCGFWAINLRTRKWTQLLSLPGWNRLGLPCDRDGDNVLFRQNAFVLNFDLQKEKLTAVQTDGLADFYSPAFSLHAGNRSAEFIGHEDYALIDGWLWSVRGQRLRLKDQIVEDVRGSSGEARFSGIVLTRVPKQSAVLVSGRQSLVLYQQNSP